MHANFKRFTLYITKTIKKNPFLSHKRLVNQQFFDSKKQRWWHNHPRPSITNTGLKTFTSASSPSTPLALARFCPSSSGWECSNLHRSAFSWADASSSLLQTLTIVNTNSSYNIKKKSLFKDYLFYEHLS